jgi:hypothetical protein
MKGAGHVARMGEIINTDNMSIEKFRKKCPFGSSMRGCEDDINTGIDFSIRCELDGR